MKTENKIPTETMNRVRNLMFEVTKARAKEKGGILTVKDVKDLVLLAYDYPELKFSEEMGESVMNEVSREELKAEAKYYAGLVRQYRAALRLCLARKTDRPWPNVPDRELYDYVMNAENLGVEP